MNAMDIDDEGLDTTDRRLLAAIVQKFASGPVGGAAVAAVIGEEVETIEDVYEPYLLQLGFLDRTPQGRVATERARDHLRRLGYEIPAPRRAERTDAGLWDGMTAEGRTAELLTDAAPPSRRHDRAGSAADRAAAARRRRPTWPSRRAAWSRATAATGAAGPRHVGAARPGLRLPGAQRLGQDHRAAAADRPHAPDAGTIELLGEPYTWRDRKRLFRVGSLIETPSFYPYLSGRENLLVLGAAGPPTPRTRIDQVLEYVGHARARQGQGPDVLAGHEAAPGHRGGDALGPGPAAAR